MSARCIMVDERRKIILARRARFVAAAASMIATTAPSVARADDASADQEDGGVFVEAGVRDAQIDPGFTEAGADAGEAQPTACLCAAAPGASDDSPLRGGAFPMLLGVGAAAVLRRTRRKKR